MKENLTQEKFVCKVEGEKIMKEINFYWPSGHDLQGQRNF